MPLATRMRMAAAGAGGGAVWWDDGGGLCLGAWLAKGAPDIATSYLDLTANGNDLTVGVLPAWNATDGWGFNALTQHLKTGIIPAANYSTIVRFNSGPAGCLIGMHQSSSLRLNIYANLSGTAYYRCGGSGQIVDGYNEGVAAVTSAWGYKDGSKHVAISGSWSGTATYEIFIGNLNFSGSPVGGADGNIQAAAIYSGTLSDGAVASITSAMQLL